jgi:hypothetical protein
MEWLPISGFSNNLLVLHNNNRVHLVNNCPMSMLIYNKIKLELIIGASSLLEDETCIQGHYAIRRYCFTHNYPDVYTGDGDLIICD